MLKREKFKIPILFIIFRRKTTALKVFGAIAKVKPARIYISQDGPRNFSEKKLVAETRESILSAINWDCRVTVWTHSKNLGLKRHIPQALRRFFKKEPYGIYLEDDTLPSEDFFYFQKEMLERFKDDERIFGISGCNLFSDKQKNEHSYYLSKIPNIWGAGLFRRAWRLYSESVNDLEGSLRDSNFMEYFFSPRYFFWARSFLEAIRKGKINTWDFQVLFVMARNNMYFINSSRNMVKNIGFLVKSTNQFLYSYSNKFEQVFPLVHPKELLYDKTSDEIYFNNLLKGGWIRLFLIRFFIFAPKWIQKSIGLLYNLIRR